MKQEKRLSLKTNEFIYTIIIICINGRRLLRLWQQQQRRPRWAALPLITAVVSCSKTISYTSIYKHSAVAVSHEIRHTENVFVVRPRYCQLPYNYRLIDQVIYKNYRP